MFESVYRSPKWLRKYVDFEISTGDDISDKISIKKQKEEIKKKWRKRWLEADEDEFKEFFKEVYSNYVNNNLNRWILSSDLQTIKSDFEGDMELWDKFDKWLKEKKEKERKQAEIKKELDDLKERLMSDFRDAPYIDKFDTPIINGKVCFDYIFENGDTFKMCDNEITYSGKNSKGVHVDIRYTIGLIYKNIFVSLINSIITNARSRKGGGSSSSSNSSNKSKSRPGQSTDPKRNRYDELLDKIKLREEQIKKMSNSDPNKQQLQNELDNYKRAAERMKDKYQFEHIKNYLKFTERL